MARMLRQAQTGEGEDGDGADPFRTDIVWSSSLGAAPDPIRAG